MAELYEEDILDYQDGLDEEGYGGCELCGVSLSDELMVKCPNCGANLCPDCYYDHVRECS